MLREEAKPELHQVLLSLFATSLAAITTDAVDDHAMTCHSKSLVRGHLITNGHQGVTLEFD